MPKDVRLIFGNMDQADQATVAKKKDVGKEVKGRKWPSAVLEKIMVVHSQHGDAGHQEVFSLRKVALTTGTPGQQVERRDRPQDAEIPKGPGIRLFPICPEGGIKILMLHLTWVISHVPMFHITQPLGINGLLDGYYFRWCPLYSQVMGHLPTPALCVSIKSRHKSSSSEGGSSEGLWFFIGKTRRHRATKVIKKLWNHKTSSNFPLCATHLPAPLSKLNRYGKPTTISRSFS